MTGRTARTRSGKVTIDSLEGDGQPKINQLFRVTRSRSRVTQKKIADLSVISSIELKEEARPDHILSGIGPSQDLGKGEELLHSNCKSSEVSDSSICTSACEVTSSPPKRSRKVSTSNKPSKISSKQLVSSARQIGNQNSGESHERANFVENCDGASEVTASITKCEDVGSYTESVLSKADEWSKLLEESSLARARLRSKICNVAQLQSALAEKGKGKLKDLHEQAMKIKSKKVEEYAKSLKSPQKQVLCGSSVSIQIKSRAKILEDSISSSVSSDIPSFVLPSNKTPLKTILKEKNDDSDEERHTAEKRRVREYGKASRLVDDVKRNVDLPLPGAYERLLETFQSCDRVLSIFTAQGKRCVLSEIQKNVQKNTRRDFTDRHLAQIIHVYPNSYEVRLEKQWQAFGGTQAGKFERIVAANLNDDLTEYMRPDSPIKNEPPPLPPVTPTRLISPRKRVASVIPREPTLDNKPRLEGWRMICRGHIFRHKLVQIVRKCHRRFMEKIGMPLSDVEEKSLRRFHPSFRLDEECEELEQVSLPEPPRDNMKKNAEMKDYLNLVDTTAPLPKAVQNAIDDLKSPVKKLVSSTCAVPLSPKHFAEQQAAKPKGTMSLLERIRAKEAQKKLEESARDPALERRRTLLQRLASSMLRCVCTFFAFKKVRSIELSQAAEQVVRSNTVMGKAEVIEHLTLLCEIAPSHIAVSDVLGKKYLQMKDNNFSAIEVLIQEEMVKINDKMQSGISQTKSSAIRSLFVEK